MKKRLTTAALLVCLTALGCVEGEQTFTLNPDGSGKVKLDVMMPTPADPFVGPPKKADGGAPEATPDVLLRKSLKGLLETRSIDAWKDVTAEFTRDGRLKITGTAYFRNAEAFEFQNMP